MHSLMKTLLFTLSLIATSASAQLLKKYSPSESCEILKASFSESALKKLSQFEGPGYAVRVVAKPRTNRPDMYDTVVIVGELHMKPCEISKRGKEFLQEFNYFAFELYMGKPQKAGKPLPPGYGLGSSSFDEFQKTYDLCGSIIMDASEEAVMRGGGKKKLYQLEGVDINHPLNWKERLETMREEALMHVAYFMVKNFNLKPGNPIDPAKYRAQIVEQSQHVAESVLGWEEAQAKEIEKNKKIMPKMGGIDIRNKVMAQNIGVIFGQRPLSSEPVIALMGSAHLSGVKHQLMLYQKFKEIPLDQVRACAAN